MKINNMWGGEYTAPALEELNVMVENGFAGSVNAYGIDDAEVDDWGNL